MSANLVVDIGATCWSQPSLPDGLTGLSESGQFTGLSGVVIGGIVDLKDTDSYCNLYITGKSVLNSGILIVGVQTSDGTTSGSFTDPTSGLVAGGNLPFRFASGGHIILCSGATTPAAGLWGSAISGYNANSGFTAFAAFQRPHRYARLVFQSGFYIGTLTGGFVSQFHTTGSGGGFTYSPTSGTVNV